MSAAALPLDLTAIIAASVAAFGAYIAASRRLSGKINTSEAQSLWQESASIREDYRARIAYAEQRTLRLEERVAQLERANNELALHNSTLVSTNADLSGTIREKQLHINELEGQVTALKDKITVLVATLKEKNG